MFESSMSMLEESIRTASGITSRAIFSLPYTFNGKVLRVFLNGDLLGEAFGSTKKPELIR